MTLEGEETAEGGPAECSHRSSERKRSKFYLEIKYATDYLLGFIYPTYTHDSSPSSIITLILTTPCFHSHRLSRSHSSTLASSRINFIVLNSLTIYYYSILFEYYDASRVICM